MKNLINIESNPLNKKDMKNISKNIIDIITTVDNTSGDKDIAMQALNTFKTLVIQSSSVNNVEISNCTLKG